MSFTKAVIFLLVPACAWCQSEMRARELFYSAGPAEAPPKPTVRRPTPKPKPKPVKPEGQAEVSVDTSAAPEASSEQNIVTVSQHTTPPARRERALGLRYSILKVEGPRNYREVDAKSVFHSGDAVIVEIEANDSGYLYVILKGTSGNWKPAFPSPEVEEGNNWVEKGRKYLMPPDSQFRLYGEPGAESLFVVLSRRPEPSLEKLIYALGAGKAAPPDAPKPDAPKKDASQLKVMMASAAPIQDDIVSQLRNAYSRDLEIQKIDDAVQGRPKEAAVYVVNPSGAADSRVVADIQLTHQ